MTDDLLRVRDLVVRYKRPGRRGGFLTAVNGADLTVRRGETVGLVGESGSGKSSIGLSILGLVDPAAGTIEFGGADITHSSRASRRVLARRMQVVFQDPYGSMNPARSVGDTVAEALRYNLGLGQAQIRDRLQRALADVGLPADTAGRYPGEFSGGQRQRIAIARALVMDPEFIVCDEAVSALDLSVQAQVLNLLARLKEQRGLSYLFISHDLAVVRYFCEQIVVLYAGRVVERGPAASIAGAPAHPYSKALIAAVPVPDPATQAQRRAARPRAAAASPLGDGTEGHGCDWAPRCPHAEPVCLTKRPELSIHDDVDVACHRADQLAAGTSYDPTARDQKTASTTTKEH
jgi:peptide/nickel transport system ATP-binding protein